MLTMRMEVAAVAVLLVLTSGCTFSAPFAEAGKGEKRIETVPGGAGVKHVFEEVTATQEAAEDRKVIKTAHLRLEVADFDGAVEELERLALEAGGYVSNSNYRITSGNRRKGTISIRIPEENFGRVIDDIKKLGRVVSFSSSGQDITEEYIDLEARLRNLKRQEERLLELLDMATSVKDVLEVERELMRVRGEIERLEGRLRYLSNRVEYATVNVELFEPEPIIQSLGLRGAVSDAVEGLVRVIRALIVASGYVLPVALLAGALFALLKMVRRSSRDG